MAGFTDAERERVRRDILDAGRDLFARHGLDKTTIADLVEPAGVAPSTFYQFFDSKEACYLEILRREGEAIVGDLVAETLGADGPDDPEVAIRQFLHRLLAVTEENPLVRKLLMEGERDRLVDAMPDDDVAAARDDKFARYAPFLAAWQDEGVVRDGDPEALAGAMLAAGYLVLHRDELGDRYETVRDALIEVVAAGLTDTSD